MLRKILLVCLLVFIFPACSTTVIVAEEARDDCRVCGMWIDQYMHTRHVLTEPDGTKISFCSFTCAARFMKTHEVDVKQLQVADYLTTELVGVKDGFYLVESDAPPVMSYTSIIAFATRESAEKFQKVHGGRIMTFDEVIAAQK